MLTAFKLGISYSAYVPIDRLRRNYLLVTHTDGTKRRFRIAYGVCNGARTEESLVAVVRDLAERVRARKR